MLNRVRDSGRVDSPVPAMVPTEYQLSGLAFQVPLSSDLRGMDPFEVHTRSCFDCTTGCHRPIARLGSERTQICLGIGLDFDAITVPRSAATVLLALVSRTEDHGQGLRGKRPGIAGSCPTSIMRDRLGHSNLTAQLSLA